MTRLPPPDASAVVSHSVYTPHNETTTTTTAESRRSATKYQQPYAFACYLSAVREWPSDQWEPASPSPTYGSCQALQRIDQTVNKHACAVQPMDSTRQACMCRSTNGFNTTSTHECVRERKVICMRICYVTGVNWSRSCESRFAPRSSASLRVKKFIRKQTTKKNKERKQITQVTSSKKDKKARTKKRPRASGRARGLCKWALTRDKKRDIVKR